MPDEVRPTLRLRFVKRVANPFVERVLRSRHHGRMSDALALLTYRGARSGTEYCVPVQYVVDEGGRYVLVPGQPEHKRWWRNFRSPRPAQLLVAGRQISGTAELLEDQAQREQALARYAQRFAPSARAMGLSADSTGVFPAGDLARAARDTIVVVVQPARE